MKLGYINWKKREAGVFEDRLWIDRFQWQDGSLIGQVFRMRIKKYLPAMEAYLLDGGPDREEILLREKDMIHPRKAGDVLLVQLMREGYGEKLALASEHLSLPKKDPAWIQLEKLLHFDPVPQYLTTLAVPLLQWMHYYQGIKWITDDLARMRKLGSDLYYGADLSKWEFTEEALDLEWDERFAPERRKWLAGEISNDYARIVIDHTEAATVIDVNQGPLSMNLSREAKIERVNSESIPLLVKAAKLQGIQGILLIDPIHMGKKEGPPHLQKLKDAFYAHHVQAQVLGFSRAGLIEVLIRRG